MRCHTLLLLAALSLPLAATAQMSEMHAKAPAPGSAVDPSQALDSLLSILEQQIVPAAKAMPADKYSFAPSSAIFAPSQSTDFKTVRTFLQQVTHVAQANFYFFSQLSDIKPDTDVRAIGNIKTKEEAVDALAKSFAYGHRVIATINAPNAFLAIKPVDGQNTRATLAAFAAAHGFDHYGQMVEYLRMNGIIPPASAR